MNALDAMNLKTINDIHSYVVANNCTLDIREYNKQEHLDAPVEALSQLNGKELSVVVSPRGRAINGKYDPRPRVVVSYY